MYPDQSLYPANSVPDGRAAHQPGAAARRPDRSTWRATARSHWFAPIVADAEAGFGGPLNAFELMKAMIEAGAAGVHFEDQLASREEVRPPGRQGARADADASSARSTPRAWRPTSWACRRCSSRAPTPTRDAHHQRRRRARPRVPDRRAHARGLLPHRAAASTARSRAALAYAPYADLVWCETAHPDLDEARALRRGRPRRASRASCWPTTARRRSTGRRSSTTPRSRASSASSARWATSSSSSRWPASTRSTTAMFELARGYRDARHGRLLPSCSRPSSPPRRTATPRRKHQREVGTGYFDEVAQAVAGGQCSTTALEGSTEEAQF